MWIRLPAWSEERGQSGRFLPSTPRALGRPGGGVETVPQGLKVNSRRCSLRTKAPPFSPTLEGSNHRVRRGGGSDPWRGRAWGQCRFSAGCTCGYSGSAPAEPETTASAVGQVPPLCPPCPSSHAEPCSGNELGEGRGAVGRAPQPGNRSLSGTTRRRTRGAVRNVADSSRLEAWPTLHCFVPYRPNRFPPLGASGSLLFPLDSSGLGRRGVRGVAPPHAERTPSIRQRGHPAFARRGDEARPCDARRENWAGSAVDGTLELEQPLPGCGVTGVASAP
jgi:hypothetical protein